MQNVTYLLVKRRIQPFPHPTSHDSWERRTAKLSLSRRSRVPCHRLHDQWRWRSSIPQILWRRWWRITTLCLEGKCRWIQPFPLQDNWGRKWRFLPSSLYGIFGRRSHVPRQCLNDQWRRRSRIPQLCTSNSLFLHMFRYHLVKISCFPKKNVVSN